MSAEKVAMSAEEFAVWRRLNRMLVQMRLENSTEAYRVFASEPLQTYHDDPTAIEPEIASLVKPVEADNGAA